MADSSANMERSRGRSRAQGGRPDRQKTATRGRESDQGRGLATFALVAAAILFVGTLNLTPITESDFWIQLKVGGMIRETGEIPRTIQFAFTEARDYPFFAHEWLPSVITSSLHARVGYRGMILFKCALALSVWALAFLLALQAGRNLVVSVALSCWVALVVNFRMQMRPEIFAFVLALASLNLIVALLSSGNWRWLVGLVPAGLLWANSHGSFLLGLALPWIFLAGTVLDDLRSRAFADPAARRTRLGRIYLPLGAAGAALFVVSLANPYGIRLLVHAISFGGADWLRDHIVEFGSTFDERVRSQPYFKVYLSYLAVVILSFAVGWRRVTATSLLLFLGFGYLSTDAIRFTAWFALAGAYVLGRNLKDLARAGAGRTSLAVAVAATLVAGTWVVASRGDVRGHPVGFRNFAPMTEKAIEFVRSSGIEGNVFNAFSHGDQLVYHFYPRIEVVIDTRIDAYGEAYYRRYASLSGRSYKLLGAPGDLTAFLDRYGVNAIVTRPFDYNNWVEKGHVGALEQDGWKVVFLDDSTVVLRREAARLSS